MSACACCPILWKMLKLKAGLLLIFVHHQCLCDTDSLQPSDRTTVTVRDVNHSSVNSTNTMDGDDSKNNDTNTVQVKVPLIASFAGLVALFMLIWIVMAARRQKDKERRRDRKFWRDFHTRYRDKRNENWDRMTSFFGSIYGPGRHGDRGYDDERRELPFSHGERYPFRSTPRMSPRYPHPAVPGAAYMPPDRYRRGSLRMPRMGSPPAPPAYEAFASPYGMQDMGHGHGHGQGHGHGHGPHRGPQRSPMARQPVLNDLYGGTCSHFLKLQG
jgi:hypothetical protein